MSMDRIKIKKELETLLREHYPEERIGNPDTPLEHMELVRHFIHIGTRLQLMVREIEKEMEDEAAYYEEQKVGVNRTGDE